MPDILPIESDALASLPNLLISKMSDMLPIDKDEPASSPNLITTMSDISFNFGS